MKYLYKYPQSEFPYRRLIEENQRRGGRGFEYELLDTGVFDEDRYFDIFVEYAKNTHNDICIRIEAFNRGPDPAPLHIIPHLWFRNTWSWRDPPGLSLRYGRARRAMGLRVWLPTTRRQRCSGASRSRTAWGLATSTRRLAGACFLRTTRRTWRGSDGAANRKPYVKDAFHRDDNKRRAGCEPRSGRHEILFRF